VIYLLEAFHSRRLIRKRDLFPAILYCTMSVMLCDKDSRSSANFLS